ncbi:hypothetical protein BDA99DRAFT_491488 [Phascolomyces articulosus]|uniref:Uncharacterized protein n=1 Tax=Phascolomyces articulosus TaxID=60185 RepID=A0AAD5KC36_9FUNG|nr:hypothetical protein BDA99DRAFT_491488 [Phascolomyces articulosus]
MLFMVRVLVQKKETVAEFEFEFCLFHLVIVSVNLFLQLFHETKQHHHHSITIFHQPS